jgi:cytidine deaminase
MRILAAPLLQAPKPMAQVATDAFIRFQGRAPQPFILKNPPLVDLNRMAPYEKLLETTKSFALPAVSGYHVGEVALGNSGKAYLGVNVEIKGGQYSDSIHGEQFLYSLARKNKETGIKQMVISAEPCGHCRQFMLEGGDANVKIIHQVTDNDQSAGNTWMQTTKRWNETTLGTLTPGPFILATPQNNMFNSKPLTLKPVSTKLSALGKLAVDAAKTSYTPLSKDTWAGVALKMKDGSTYTGSVIESAAYNPTLPPFQDAIVGVVAAHQSLGDIAEAVLAEPESPNFSYANQSRLLLKQVAPQARFKVVKARQNS